MNHGAANLDGNDWVQGALGLLEGGKEAVLYEDLVMSGKPTQADTQD
jgi:hypothetical protein